MTADAVRAMLAEDNSSDYALDAHCRGIERIAGLDHRQCMQLRSVDLSFNRIAEIEGLDGLAQLRELKPATILHSTFNIDKTMCLRGDFDGSRHAHCRALPCQNPV